MPKLMVSKSPILQSKYLVDLINVITYFYTRHLVISQNKKFKRQFCVSSSIKTAVAVLWANRDVSKQFSSARLLKYLYLYYLQSINYVVRYYL